MFECEGHQQIVGCAPAHAAAAALLNECKTGGCGGRLYLRRLPGADRHWSPLVESLAIDAVANLQQCNGGAPLSVSE